MVSKRSIKTQFAACKNYFRQKKNCPSDTRKFISIPWILEALEISGRRNSCLLFVVSFPPKIGLLLAPRLVILFNPSWSYFDPYIIQFQLNVPFCPSASPNVFTHSFYAYFRRAQPTRPSRAQASLELQRFFRTQTRVRGK